MAIKMTQNTGRWKKGEIITLAGGMEERLVGQGKAVPVKAPPSSDVQAGQKAQEAHAGEQPETTPAKGRGKGRRETGPESAQEA